MPATASKATTARGMITAMAVFPAVESPEEAGAAVLVEVADGTPVVWPELEVDWPLDKEFEIVDTTVVGGVDVGCVGDAVITDVMI